jgi:ATP-dependent RNA helicase DDX10/DBP4
MAPNGEITGRRRPTKTKKADNILKRKRETVTIEELEQRVEDLDVSSTSSYKSFTDLPLSEPTLDGLKSSHFTTLTDIQAKAIPVALKGNDILGAAKTGSGKTLAFLVPVLENLYRDQCVGPDAGLGAMILSPTRELAIQIFEVLRKIGRKGHMFSAGLVIGGKSLAEEQDALVKMNIVVCTPGRMLQHLSQTAAFNVDSLKMLVLDEADRILDMGFQRDVDAIVDYLPKERQTMLFSATQTKRVSDLARLSLQDPSYISVHEAASNATPKTLQQNYTLTPLAEKLDTLWSFLQSAKKSKILVFLSSAKQVRFVYEAFRKMQPGIPLLHLHGRQKQMARLDITHKFASAQASCLFATDVAARGLDFPAVDWVVQVDCPEDADTYIHRVGRTARYNREGRAVLLLDPSEEEGMLARLSQKKVPIERINVRQKKKTSITNQLANLCFKDPSLKYLAQKAFTSYAKSIYVQKDKEIFQLSKLGLEEYATSLGLPGAPRIKFMKGDDAKARKNAPRHLYSSGDESSGDEDEEGGKEKERERDAKKVRTKYDKMFERVNQDIFTEHYAKLQHQDVDSAAPKTRGDALNGGLGGEEEGDDDFLSVKRRIPLDDEEDDGLPEDDTPDLRPKKLVHINGAAEPLLIDSNRAAKRLTSKKALLKFKDRGTKLVFDDEGNARPLYVLEGEAEFAGRGAPEDQRKAFVEGERERVALGDVEDKEEAKRKRREKKRKARERERAEAELDGDSGGEAQGVELEGGEDALANFLADAEGLNSDDEGGRVEDRDEEPKRKKAKKWFQDSGSEDEGGKGKRKKGRKGMAEEEQVPETLEDLEAMAAGLLG